jgi:hypothetical protein
MKQKSQTKKPESPKPANNLPVKASPKATSPAVAEKQQGALSLNGTAINNYKGMAPEVAGYFDVDDNIRGVKGKLPQIKIAHQVNLFQDATGATMKEFDGIILHHNSANAWWLKPFDETGGGEIPDCFSTDAFHPDGETVQAACCAECVKNKFKSADGGEGRGKACKNMWRLHILVDGQVIPKRLTLPPSNIGAVQEFLIGLRDRNIAHELAVVRFGLKPSKNKDGIAYSTIAFELKSVIEDLKTAKALKNIKESFATSFDQAITSEEMEAETGNKL